MNIIIPHSVIVGTAAVGTIGAVTLTLAEAVPPVPPSVEVTFPVVLFFTPVLVPVTLTEKVQLPMAVRLPPLRMIVPDPAVAVIVLPPHVPVRPLGVEITRPGGSVSVKPTPVNAVEVLGLFIVKLNAVDPFS